MALLMPIVLLQRLLPKQLDEGLRAFGVANVPPLYRLIDDHFLACAYVLVGSAYESDEYYISIAIVALRWIIPTQRFNQTLILASDRLSCYRIHDVITAIASAMHIGCHICDNDVPEQSDVMSLNTGPQVVIGTAESIMRMAAAKALRLEKLETLITLNSPSSIRDARTSHDFIVSNLVKAGTRFVALARKPGFESMGDLFKLPYFSSIDYASTHHLPDIVQQSLKDGYHHVSHYHIRNLQMPELAAFKTLNTKKAMIVCTDGAEIREIVNKFKSTSYTHTIIDESLTMQEAATEIDRFIANENPQSRIVFTIPSLACRINDPNIILVYINYHPLPDEYFPTFRCFAGRRGAVITQFNQQKLKDFTKAGINIKPLQKGKSAADLLSG
eukprot:jgi/Hompol1/1934/HPOL_005789-RA